MEETNRLALLQEQLGSSIIYLANAKKNWESRKTYNRTKIEKLEQSWAEVEKNHRRLTIKRKRPQLFQSRIDISGSEGIFGERKK